MAIKVYNSGAGLLALLFYAAVGVGGFFMGYFYRLGEYTAGDIISLVNMILVFAAAGFAVIALVIALFGIPRFLWILFAFLSLVCAFLPLLLPLFAGGSFDFVYISLSWYGSNMFDFIGFWLAIGGSFLALVFGFFIPERT
ncbi:MAG: hypothetical protein ACXABK_06945 [Candidatus Heimdallarchaeaceae archaeon]|jgi:hypothetical protein